MLCTICGNTIYRDETFCSKCGKSVNNESSRPHTSPPPPPPRGAIAPHSIPQPPRRRSEPSHLHHDDLYVPPPHHVRPTPPHYSNPALPPSTYHQPGSHFHPPGSTYHEYDISSPNTNSGLKKVAIVAVCIAMFAIGVSVGALFVMRRDQTSSGHPPENPNINDVVVASPTPFPQRNTPEPTLPPQEEVEEPQETPQPYEPEELDDARSARFPFPGNMMRYGGSSEADVAFLQNTLNNIRRHYRSIRLIDTASGTFGAATFGAVVDFQIRVGLQPTGVVDEDTWYALVEVFENPPLEPDPHFTPVTQEWYVTLVRLHLRSEPSMAGESIDLMDQWSSVWVAYYIAQDSWFFVSTEDGYTGYMKAEFLLLDGILQ